MLMRTLLVTVLLLAVICPAFAQGVPDAITYQGQLTNASGQPVSNGTYQVVFKFFGVVSGGIPLWTSPDIWVTTTGGTFTARIEGVPASVFAGSDVWLETVVAGQTLAPRVKFTSVPYAIRAGNAGGSGDGWSLTGNAGTNQSVNFLGTTDNELPSPASTPGVATISPMNTSWVLSS